MTLKILLFSWGPSPRLNIRFYNLGYKVKKRGLIHTRTHAKQSIAQIDENKVCHQQLFEVLSHYQLLLQSASTVTLGMLIDLKAGWTVAMVPEFWELIDCCEYFPTWLLFRLTVAGHHFPKIIFLVFILRHRGKIEQELGNRKTFKYWNVIEGWTLDISEVVRFYPYQNENEAAVSVSHVSSDRHV